MQRLHALPLALLFTGLLLACDDTPSPAPTVAVEETGDGDTILYDTVVFQASDGTTQSREVPITLRERRAQEAAREASAKTLTTDLARRSQAIVTSDASCASSDLWVYDGTSFTGKRLCLRNQNGTSAPSDFSLWCHTFSPPSCPPSTICHQTCVETWDGKVKMYLPGNKEGTLLGNASNGRPYQVTFTSNGGPASVATGTQIHQVELICPYSTGSGGAGGRPTSCDG